MKVKLNHIGIIALIMVVAAVFALIENPNIIKAASVDPIISQKTSEELIEDGIINSEPVISGTETVHVHVFGEYEITEAPTCNKNGIETRVCETCGEREERNYICKHKNSFILESTNPTCRASGTEIYACVDCGTITETKTLEKLHCSYGDWIYTKYATPFESGNKQRECAKCGDVEKAKYTVTMAGQNSIYIPGTGINHVITIDSFTQAAVDKNDIVYADDVRPTEGPFVLGHQRRTMHRIQHTEVGQYVYLSVNGNIEVYEVVISEFALFDKAENDIVGQTTGTSVWDHYDVKTLHMFTCHGEANGRWLVLAKLVDQQKEG